MKKFIQLLTEELLQVFRNFTFSGLMLLLLALMALASWNAFDHTEEKKEQVQVQKEIVEKADEQLMKEIDSLNRGLATYKNSYTLPTNGIRLSYNNHRLASLPFQPYSLISIGQGDIYNSYKKIILYYSDSYNMSTKELESPIEQLFGQLDLSFIWIYIMPLIIILISFNVLSLERETGRLPLIASQPIKIGQWLAIRLGVKFIAIILLLTIFSSVLLTFFGVSVWKHPLLFGQLILLLSLYNAFWFFLGFLINLLGYSSGKNLIILTSIWVLFIFLVPSAINQIGKEIHPLPSRLEIVNHHQESYNQIEKNLDNEMKNLYKLHPDWYSEDPDTKDMSHPTGWNINYLAKEYVTQLKHQPVSEAYEAQVDSKNSWFGKFRLLSPAMILQEALADMAGTSTKYYRSYLRQAHNYTNDYRQYVFKGIFTNHAFSVDEIKNLPKFHFDEQQVPDTFSSDSIVLIVYLMILLIVGFITTINTKTKKQLFK